MGRNTGRGRGRKKRPGSVSSQAQSWQRIIVFLKELDYQVGFKRNPVRGKSL